MHDVRLVPPGSNVTLRGLRGDIRPPLPRRLARVYHHLLASIIIYPRFRVHRRRGEAVPPRRRIAVLNGRAHCAGHRFFPIREIAPVSRYDAGPDRSLGLGGAQALIAPRVMRSAAVCTPSRPCRPPLPPPSSSATTRSARRSRASSMRCRPPPRRSPSFGAYATRLSPPASGPPSSSQSTPTLSTHHVMGKLPISSSPPDYMLTTYPAPYVHRLSRSMHPSRMMAIPRQNLCRKTIWTA
jgi:hypothetical protein